MVVVLFSVRFRWLPCCSGDEFRFGEDGGISAQLVAYRSHAFVHVGEACDRFFSSIRDCEWAVGGSLLVFGFCNGFE